MFTGLVREVGRVVSLAGGSRATLVELSAPATAPGLSVGDSLAVNGICLTVTRLARTRVWADASPETRRVTTLRRWRPGDRVHLEPSLRAGDPLGGHLVLGHVDGTGTVAGLDRAGGAIRMRVALDPALCRDLVPKGSIAVDGVSLTLDEGPFVGGFEVTLVPHTLRATIFGRLARGAWVNVELDVLAKAAREARGSAPGSSAGSTTQFPTSSARPGDAPVRLQALRALGWDRLRG